MDMTQQPTVLSRNPHTEGRALGSHRSHHTPRPESPMSTHWGSSPRTSQGKASMDIERNTRPFPDKFSPSAFHMTRAQVLGGYLLLWIAGASERKHSVAKLYMIA